MKKTPQFTCAGVVDAAKRKTVFAPRPLAAAVIVTSSTTSHLTTITIFDVEVGGNIFNGLDSFDDTDLFEIELDVGESIQINMCGVTLDALCLAFCDEKGTPVGCDTDARPSTLASLLTVAAMSGGHVHAAH